MGYFIMKPDPDEDFYVEWSTYVDEPIAYGPKSEFQTYDPERYKDARFDRADEIGTTSYLSEMKFGVESMWICQQWEIPRKNLKAYVEETFKIEGFRHWEPQFAHIVEKHATRLVFDD